jgi:hypothetical protein
MLRRLSITGLALGLVLLGPAPLSACAMWMQLPGECAPALPAPPPEPASHCDHLKQAAAGEASVSGALDASCCVVKNVAQPASQSKQLTPQFTLAATASQQPQIIAAAAPRAIEAEFRFEHSPPDLQPLLCVFLI